MANPVIGTSVGFYGAGNTSNSKESITDTIARLERERDKLDREDERANSERINNLENRIGNLQKWLDKMKSEENDGECKTCESRRYQDVSDDPGVSFKSASKIAPGNVGAAVRGHEQEHVVRERAKADREDREVVSQSVVIKTAICPECGKSYVAGGETTTVTRSKPSVEARFQVGGYDRESEKGRFFDVTV
ncbi:MAG: hypothetical protein K2N06_01310 [Oscillospiraceae bacterium]|nr:hypothetical protein [Oscillospiraceae bacterium]